MKPKKSTFMSIFVIFTVFGMVFAACEDGSDNTAGGILTVPVTGGGTSAVSVTSVSLNKTTLALTAGDSETLTPTVLPANATNKTITWESSNNAVATVGANGKVEAKAVGSATITVTTADGRFTATCDITVIGDGPVTPISGLSFSLINNGTEYSVSKGTITDGSVVIPAQYEGKPVTRIASFSNISITSITIPDSVTNISEGAFRGCNSLKSITLPFIGENKTATEYKAVFGFIFGYTWEGSIYQVATPAGTTLQYTNTEIRTGYSNYYTYYFYYIPSSLKSVTVTGGSISDNAFYNCSGLTSITIPDSVTSIGVRAFSSCSGLTSITIPDSVTSIGDGAFSSCSGLTSITIPDSVTSIGVRAFGACSGLTSIIIPDSVTSISNSAFASCFSMTSITIPASITSIGGSAFIYDDDLETVFYGGADNTDWTKITIGDFNYWLNDATRYYYSETSNTDGNHWHFVDGIPTVW